MQISFFDGNQQFKINKPVRLIELFAGIGSQAKALKNLGVSFEHYRICEFDKYAVASYNAVHGTNFETSDITKITAQDLGIVDTDKYCYIMTYSFPCQDLSKAGLGKGMAKDSGTRSGLLWEVERLLDECKGNLPQVLLMENVPDVIGTNNVKHFAKWIEKLESAGYKCYWKVLNAKDYGIPQNRERCFMVSILGDYYYSFPQGKKLELRLKDMLEKEVDEKYYLSSSAIERISKWNAYQYPLKNIEKEKLVSPCLTARGAGEEHSGMVLISEPNLKRELCDELIANGMVEEGDVIRHSYTRDRLENGDKNMGRTESKDKLCPTLDTRCDCLGITVKDEQNQYLRQDGCVGTLTTDGSSPKHNNRIIEPLCWDGYNQRIRANSSVVGTLTRNCGLDLKRNGQGIIEPKVIGGIGEKKSNGGTQWYQQDRVYDNELAISVTTSFNPFYKDNAYRIRKLTPKECWRLMGFDDADIDKAIAIGMSNAQLYKQAGNSLLSTC